MTDMKKINHIARNIYPAVILLGVVVAWGLSTFRSHTPSTFHPNEIANKSQNLISELSRGSSSEIRFSDRQSHTISF